MNGQEGHISSVHPPRKTHILNPKAMEVWKNDVPFSSGVILFGFHVDFSGVD